MYLSWFWYCVYLVILVDYVMFILEIFSFCEISRSKLSVPSTI